ncbi:MULTISPECIES: hypothetical protein [unclassified Hyphomicrobium]|uniref:hypothetical protein n=1 Tax=unclassified Hyphomicrobium TaxID=2619925 RepID=UPI000213F034|nr:MULTISPECIES: hypothetical protein [unclassified Hyphomicrobium]CCB67935.1 protein of unknown function [Hyphomicrobium sp. MC1]
MAPLASGGSDDDPLRSQNRARADQGCDASETCSGKYDVFAWQVGPDLHAIPVAWKSFTKRSVALEAMTLSDGNEIQTNAAPLPNGVGSKAARYVGSFRIDKRTGEDQP